MLVVVTTCETHAWPRTAGRDVYDDDGNHYIDNDVENNIDNDDDDENGHIVIVVSVLATNQGWNLS